MPGSLRVGFYVPRFIGGGAELMSARIAEELARRGRRVTLIVDRHVEDQPSAPQGVEIRTLGTRSTMASAKALAGLASEIELDVLISVLPMANLVADLAFVAFGLRIPVINAWHGFLRSASFGRGYLAQAGCSVLCRIADANIVVSRALQRALIRLGAPADRLSVVYNGVSCPAHVTPYRAPRPYVLNVASLTPHKNQQMLIRAFAGFRRTHDWDLLIAGRGPEEARLRALAEELGLADHVQFLGFREDVFQYHAGASLFALSSNTESFSNVVVEALSYGTPVVATDCGGPREVLDDGRFGRLVPIKDAEAFETAMTAAASEPIDRERLKARAAEFTLERTVDAYDRLCLDLVARRR